MQIKLEKLGAQFVDAIEKQSAAWKVGDSKTANQHAKKISKAVAGFRAHGTEGREELARFLDHRDDRVASYAATYSLKYSTERSLSVLRRIAKGTDVLALECAQCIRNWETGAWQLE
jgi:hypothetical protein